MIFETTYRNDNAEVLISEELGKSFTFWQRWKMGGIGSKRMVIENASPEIVGYLQAIADMCFGNIELRPKGILLHFNKGLRRFTWLIPYIHLQTSVNQYFRIQSGEIFIEFRKDGHYNENLPFIKRMLVLQQDFIAP